MRDDRPIRRLAGGLRRLAGRARRALRAAWIAARSDSPAASAAAASPPPDWPEERRRLIEALALERQDLARAAAGIEGFRRLVAQLEADLAAATISAPVPPGEEGVRKALEERAAEVAALRDLLERARAQAARAGTLGMERSVRLMRAAADLAPRGRAGAAARARLAVLFVAEGLIDPAWYGAAYPDAAAGGRAPALHWLERGLAEGRPPRRPEGEPPATSADPAATDRLVQALALAFSGPWPWRRAARLRLARALERSGAFDPAAYRAANPDVAAAGLDPGLHFLEHGLREGRPGGRG
jgi:hypothetical protein